MRAAIFLALVGTMGAAAAIGGGCAAQGNDIPNEEVIVDAGHRDVLTATDDPFDSSVASYDAGALYDAGAADAAPDSNIPVSACAYPSGAGNSCITAVDLGSVSGDTNPSINSITYTGNSSEWLSVTVREDSSSFINHDPTVKLTLTSPAGGNYDLFAYVDSNGTPTTHSCQTVSNQSTNAAGLDDEVTLKWPDKMISQPNDDTRIVSIRIDQVSGPCGPGNDWSLVVQGNP